MRRLAPFLFLLLIAAAILLLAPTPSFAACHAFTVVADPSSVTEGGSITVRVGRDAAVGPSSVQVTSSDETATGDVDYEKVNRRIEFTSETEQTFSVATKEDSSPEGTETFLLQVKNGQGCAVNPSFRYGAPAQVQIQDNDSAPPAPAGRGGSSGTTARTPAAAASSPSPASSPTDSPEPAAPVVTGDSPTPSLTLTPRSLAQEESDQRSSAPLIIAAVALVVAIGAGAGWWWLRRRAA